MTIDAGLVRMYRRFVDASIPCFVGGSVAGMVYGEPRSTLDIDMVIDLDANEAERIVAAFPLDDHYVPPLDVIRRELSRGGKGSFNIVEFASGLKADVYPAGDDPLIAYGFATARLAEIANEMVRVASATYVVVMKLRYHAMSGQDKHLRDIRSMLAMSPDAVDISEIERLADQFGVRDAWNDSLYRKGEE